MVSHFGRDRSKNPPGDMFSKGLRCLPPYKDGLQFGTLCRKDPKLLTELMRIQIRCIA